MLFDGHRLSELGAIRVHALSATYNLLTDKTGQDKYEARQCACGYRFSQDCGNEDEGEGRCQEYETAHPNRRIGQLHRFHPKHECYAHLK